MDLRYNIRLKTTRLDIVHIQVHVLHMNFLQRKANYGRRKDWFIETAVLSYEDKLSLKKRQIARTWES